MDEFRPYGHPSIYKLVDFMSTPRSTHAYASLAALLLAFFHAQNSRSVPCNDMIHKECGQTNTRSKALQGTLRYAQHRTTCF